MKHYANEAARVVQDLCKSCRVPAILFYLFYFGAKWQNSCTIFVQEFYFILFYFGAKLQKFLHNSCARVLFFWRKVAKFLHNSCERFYFILFYFILLQMGEPLKRDRVHKTSALKPRVSVVGTILWIFIYWIALTQLFLRLLFLGMFRWTVFGIYNRQNCFADRDSRSGRKPCLRLHSAFLVVAPKDFITFHLIQISENIVEVRVVRVVRRSSLSNPTQPNPSNHSPDSTLPNPSQNENFGPMTQPNPRPNRTPCNQTTNLRAHGRQC